MKLSVIIVNYNVKFFVEQCLLSVRAAVSAMEQVYGTGCTEVYLVDNNSVDGSCEMVAEKFPEVILIANRENTGFSKANNQALRIAGGEYMLLLNPDTVVENDTFVKTVQFMDLHPEAGGLGVKMLDGKGNFLPESKRGLPTPEVAFYKIFGISALFKNSRRFGKYHLTYLDKDQNHEVEILSGAFMLMRKTALDKVGLLDEDYFMYGEDIDLSYRLLKGGYKNYYFADTRIIHYKGESTKKSSINYVFVFYRAMIIFARKHFSGRHAGLFSFLINSAIWLRAGLAIFRRFILKAALPFFDFSVLYVFLFLLKTYWEQNHKYVEGGAYPPEFSYFVLPAYALLWMLGLAVSGGYGKNYRIAQIVRGVGGGTLVILIVYALLSEEFRYSRAIILIGAVAAVGAFSITRMILQFIKTGSFNFERGIKKRCVIVADEEEYIRISDLLKQTGNVADVIGMVNVRAKLPGSLGTIHQLGEVIQIYGITEIIFSSKDLTVADIIAQMDRLKSFDTEYKIAPPESIFIIGSSSVNTRGELYMMGLNSINSPENKRRKRVVDISASFLFLLGLPLLIWRVRSKQGFISNIFRVISGKVTWVGFCTQTAHCTQGLPQLKSGILSPADAFPALTLEEERLRHLNLLYAKNYSVSEDIKILFKGFRNAGNPAM
jgi:GT2 family glycosyltransferase